LRYVIILMIMASLYSIPSVQAQSWYQTTEHPANFCIPCHQRFAENSVHATDIPNPMTAKYALTIFPCTKPGCHKINPDFPEKKRWSKHLGICGNCHSQKNGKYDIHEIHLNFSLLEPPWVLEYPQNISLRTEGVECKLCHATPEGYNSSIVSVPPLNVSIPRIPGTVIKPPWNNDCSYCHPTVNGAKRLHDVHEPIILKACPVCHTSRIFSRKDFLIRVAGEKSLFEKKLIEIKEEFFVIKELRNYFSAITDQLIKVYISIIGGEAET